MSDLDLFAGLGIKALRYPALWERIAPEQPTERHWGWTDVRFARLRELAIRPIVGLVHHGSGPRYTDLVDANFARGLADHARAVAARYPWATEWTPVNEPVTTARFAALYGHWYPHHRDERSFWIALLNQIDGTRLAMRAVREVNPAARLIQTEDLGRTYATFDTRDQAAFDNTRRWMSWDLLCGHVVPQHALWDRLCTFGLRDRLAAIADDPCPPDVIGVNHYLTSDRFLDHRLGRYPPRCRGGNGRDRFVDVEAVRVLQPRSSGLAGVLREAWERYRIPLAITEVHNGSTREEQMRWMVDAWQTARALRGEGIGIRAVTNWAVLGSSGWNTLLTDAGLYEPGAYDISGGEPRATALVPLLQSLSRCEDADLHPVLQGTGWWHRPIRLHHPTVPHPAPAREHAAHAAAASSDRRPILIVGATGTLGGALAAACRHRDLHHVSTGRAEIDLSEPATIEAALDRHRPWAVINAAGWVRVDEAEHEAAACFEANAHGAERLARACGERGIHCTNFSSDLVFGEGATHAFGEADAPRPMSVYGRSKSAMEQGVAALPGRQLIVRTAAFFSAFDLYNFAFHLARTLDRGEAFVAADDQVITPTYVPHLCDAVLDLVIDDEAGIWHLTNGEALSWAAFAGRLARACGLDEDLVRPTAGRALGWIAPRPAMTAMTSTRGRLLPTLDRAIEQFAAESRRASVPAKLSRQTLAGQEIRPLLPAG